MKHETRGRFIAKGDYQLRIEIVTLITGMIAGSLGSLLARAWPLRRRLVHEAWLASLRMFPLLRPCRGGQRRWCPAVIPPRQAGGAALWLLVGTALCALTGAAKAAERPNVLLIAIDDLNDWVGHLGGHPQAKTPHIDALAKRGVTFTNAYTAALVCNPSRAAMFSGKRPSTSAIYDNTQDWRPHLPPPLMLPTQFRNAGYRVAGSRKLYHHGFDRQADWGQYSPYALSQRDTNCGTNAVTAADGLIKYAVSACTDPSTSDHRTVPWMVDRLKENHSKPFFFGLGIWLPHLYWYVSKNYDVPADQCAAAAIPRDRSQ